jgi:hypothetical protein
VTDFAMKRYLPLDVELEALTLRAVVAYAARSTRRICADLVPEVGESALAACFLPIECFLHASDFEPLEPSLCLEAIQKLLETYSSADSGDWSARRLSMVLSILQCALACEYALQGARKTRSLHETSKKVIHSAQRAVSPIIRLGEPAHSSLVVAARDDYDILFQHYAKHSESEIGHPINCF